jgi:hypothetical protein
LGGEGIDSVRTKKAMVFVERMSEGDQTGRDTVTQYLGGKRVHGLLGDNRIGHREERGLQSLKCGLEGEDRHVCREGVEGSVKNLLELRGRRRGVTK